MVSGRAGRPFTKFGKDSVFITGSNGAGDGLQVVMDYVRMLTHVDILVYNSLLDQVQGKTGQILQMIRMHRGTGCCYFYSILS